MRNILPIIITSMTPTVAWSSTHTLKFFVDKFVGFINMIIPVLISLAILLFFYHSGMGIFSTSSGDATSKSRLKQTLIWGVIIIFVMVSIAGILNFVTTNLDLNATR